MARPRYVERRVVGGDLKPGEPVAVWAGNGPDWVLLEFAAGLAGLTLVTVNPAYQAEELAHVLGQGDVAAGDSPAPGRRLPAHVDHPDLAHAREVYGLGTR